LADAIHDFGSGMKRPVPAQRTGLAEWEVEIGDCVQDLCREALFQECSFSRNVRECAYLVMKTNYPYLVGFKADLTLRV